jgi:DNA-binding NarL/FixJ family response regulator
MTAFFVCIILIGIIIVGIAMVWIVIERKNSRDYRLDIDERRYELQQAIEDAEQLLNELNNFSDYIVNRMEEKQQEIESVINSASEKTDLYENTSEQALNINQFMKKSNDVVSEVSDITENKQENPAELTQSKKGKIISFDAKKREVLNLYKKGIGSTDIARMLNMGKGEIELISRISK